MGQPQIAQRGIVWKRTIGRGGTQTISLIVIVNGCHTEGHRDHPYVVLSCFFPVGCIINSSHHDTLRYE
jgi:hypothetical protein